MSELSRLLFCSFDVIPGPTGSSRRLAEYLKGLQDRFQVVVLSAKTPDHSHIERFHGARLLRVPVGTGDLQSRLMAFERAVRRQLESEEYVLAHFTDPFGGYALCEQKNEYGYRLVYEAIGFPSQELRYTHPATEGDRRFLSKVRRQELYCLMNADVVITGSQTTRRFIRSLGVSDELVRVLRAPVDLSLYRPDQMALPDGNPMRVLYLGSQAGYQGLPTLLRAMQLAQRQVDLRLALVGPQHPDWQAHLQDLVDELHLSGKVELQPPVGFDDLHKVVGASDVGVLPLDDCERNREQGGALSKISEYFAGGRPVIAADLPVTRELLPESAALFFRPGDYKQLAESLVHLAKNPSRRVELGARARADAVMHLDASLVRGKLLDIYDELLGNAPARGREQPEGPVTQIGTPTGRVDESPDRRRETEPAIHLADLDEPERRRAGNKPWREPTEPESLPVVVGFAVAEETVSGPAAITEPDARAPGEPPVVMGTPLRDSEAAPKVALADAVAQNGQPSPPRLVTPRAADLVDAPLAQGGRPPSNPKMAAARPAEPVDAPLASSGRPPSNPKMAAARPAEPVDGPLAQGGRASSNPRLTAIRPASSGFAPAMPSQESASGEGRATPAVTLTKGVALSPVVPANLVPLGGDDPLEVSSDDIVEADEAQEGPSKLDPWFAQLAHGYCPPEGAQFARPVPPTNFPGREEAPGRGK